MENEIKKLISEWNWELTHETTNGIRKNTIAFLEDLESLLRFKQENCEKSKDKSMIVAFVQGAQWWEYRISGVTMGPGDKNRAGEEAVRRLEGGTLGITGITIEEIANENAMSGDGEQ